MNETRRGRSKAVDVASARQAADVAPGELTRAMQQGVEQAAELVADAADDAATAGRDLARAATPLPDAMLLSSTAAPPGAAAAARPAAEAMSTLLGELMQGAARTNLRMARAMFRLGNPAAMLAMQQRIFRSMAESLAEPEEPRSVATVMQREVRVAAPEDSAQDAARLMAEEGTGALPVREGDRLVGMVTDRDLALRLVAEGRDARTTRVREVMTPDIRWIFEDETLDRAAEIMADQQVRRLPVVNRERHLVGIVSLGDLARGGDAESLPGRALGARA